jgi:hypothetical protein
MALEFNLFGSGLPRQRHELERGRGRGRFAHHAKRSNRIALTKGGDTKIVTGVLAAVLLLAGIGASHAVVRVADNRGGRIGAYVDKYQGLRSSGETVVIDGLCASACTIVLSAVPHERICVTSHAAPRHPFCRDRQHLNRRSDKAPPATIINDAGEVAEVQACPLSPEVIASRKFHPMLTKEFSEALTTFPCRSYVFKSQAWF